MRNGRCTLQAAIDLAPNRRAGVGRLRKFGADRRPASSGVCYSSLRGHLRTFTLGLHWTFERLLRPVNGPSRADRARHVLGLSDPPRIGDKVGQIP